MREKVTEEIGTETIVEVNFYSGRPMTLYWIDENPERKKERVMEKRAPNFGLTSPLHFLELFI